MCAPSKYLSSPSRTIDFGVPRVRFVTDNQPAYYQVNKRDASTPMAWGLLLRLCTLAETFGFFFSSSHLAGVRNTVAVALSRDFPVSPTFLAESGLLAASTPFKPVAWSPASWRARK